MGINLGGIMDSPATSPLRSKIEGGRALAAGQLALLTGAVRHDRIFGGASDDVWFALNTHAYRRWGLLRKLLPALPDEATQRAFIGNAGDDALREAFRFYQIVRTLAARHGSPINGKARVLDVGCGWGRTLRFFLRDVPASQLHGVDVLPKAIELSRRTNPWCQFSVVQPGTSTAFPDGAFDVVYMYSVFSHLSEPAHRQWLNELARLLRPGGLFMATTWDRDYIARCEQSRHGDLRGAHLGSVDAFVGTADWLARYDRGEFCHSAVGGDQALDAEYYGETCIPEAYVRAQWSNQFEIAEYLPADRDWLWQNLIVARRRH
jgi:SAM-dependent methyltransferase